MRLLLELSELPKLPNKRDFPSGPAHRFSLSEARRLQCVALTFYKPLARGSKVINRGTGRELDVLDVTLDTVVRHGVTIL
ncbi:hypothetical protein ACIBL8_01050 [Streptomyces sp. NPDC050523]|uniref:hypothetical protein n=1 Tax=Streptomyces sp. NPDC050523 TaxID=3365622 RepID=UPI0037A754EE